MFRVTPYRAVSRNRDVFDLFDDFFGTTRTIASFKMDVKDLEKEYIIEAELPGFTKEDLNIHYENEKLTISVVKEEDKEEKTDEYIHRERYLGSRERSVYLKDVDPKKLKAKLENGILVITAPKHEDAINKYLVDIE